MTHRITTSQIKAGLIDRLPALLGALRIQVHKEYREYFHCFAPLRKEANPSFYIRKTGGWKDLAGVDAPFTQGGDRGDVIDLIAYCKCGRDRDKAFREARIFLGLDRGDISHWQKEVAKAERRQAEKKIDDAAQRAKDQARAFGKWLNATSPLGTVTETYLRERRGVDLRRMPRLPGLIRHIEAEPHECGERFPCMIVGCVDGDGEIKAVHRTWLARDGRDKVDVRPARKVWPDFAGLFIPLWRGQSRLSLADLRRQRAEHGVCETLGLIEGVEKGLAWAYACPELRIWAAISLSNLGNIVIPDCFDIVLIARDNDWKPQAIRQFESARAALVRATPHAAFSDVVSPTGKDMDELLRGNHEQTGEESESGAVAA